MPFYDNQYFLKDDPIEMEKSKVASWLCKIFQQNKLTVTEKQDVIRAMIAEYEKKKYLEELPTSSTDSSGSSTFSISSSTSSIMSSAIFSLTLA